MEVQRTYTIVLEECDALRRMLGLFGQGKRAISATCFNEGETLNQLKLHKVVYRDLKALGLNSQMSCNVIRSVAAAYSSAKSTKRPATRAFGFHRDHALFLVGESSRQARFLEDGRLSITTPDGRKKIGYREASGFEGFLEQAKLVHSIHVIERDGALLGQVCVTLEVEDPDPIHPVGVDLNETNAMVAVDADDRVFFLSGREEREQAKSTRKTRARLQRKLASRKAEGKSTRSVRRALKRLGKKQRDRTRTTCQMMAAELSKFAGKDAVLVLEELKFKRKTKRNCHNRARRRRLNGWPYALMRQCIENRAQMSGQTVVVVNPAYTSQDCNRCGLKGRRKRHEFSCKCGYKNHADINASLNLRDKYTASRRSGASSAVPEALTTSCS